MNKAKYIRIADILMDRIMDGIYTPSSGFPRMEELCREFSTSRSNLHKVLNLLLHRGLIERKRGKRVQLNNQGTKTILFLCVVPHSENSHELQKYMRSFGTTFSVEDKNSIFTLLYSGIRKYADDYQMNMIVSMQMFPGSKLTLPLDHVDGVVLMGDNLEEFYQTELKKYHLPVCAIGAKHLLNTDFVSADYFEGGGRAAFSICKAGLKRPAVIIIRVWNTKMLSVEKMKDAFLFVMEQNHSSPAFVQYVDYDDLFTGKKSFTKLKMKLEKLQPDSLVFFGAQPVSMVRKIKNCSLLPAIAVDFKGMTEPSWNLKFIGFNAAEIGYTAAMRLSERIKKPDLPIVRLLIPCSVE